MKFDLILTNPPFQNSNHGEKKNTLWRKFIEKSIKTWSTPTATICLITPSSWCGSRPLMKLMYPAHALTYLNKDECKRHFPGIGSSFSAWVLQKSTAVSTTSIVNQTPAGDIQLFHTDLRDSLVDGILPRDLSFTAQLILKKIFDKPPLGIRYSTVHHTVHKHLWSKIQSEEFCYPSYSSPTAAGKKWFSFPGEDQENPKIIIPTTTYYHKLWYVDTGATCQSVPYYVLQSQDHPEAVVANLRSRIMCWANEQFRYSNWNNSKLLCLMPTIPTDRILDDEELFDWFGLTDEEREYVDNAR